MNTRNRIVVGALVAAALAVPAAAGAQPGKGHGKPAARAKKAKKVTYVFHGTFTAPGTIEVAAGNAHVRKGGFVGEAVTFDFASAKVVVADTNGDQVLDVTDVTDGDSVLVQASLAKGTKYAEDAEATVARKLVDESNPPVEVVEAGD